MVIQVNPLPALTLDGARVLVPSSGPCPRDWEAASEGMTRLGPRVAESMGFPIPHLGLRRPVQSPSLCLRDTKRAS